MRELRFAGGSVQVEEFGGGQWVRVWPAGDSGVMQSFAWDRYRRSLLLPAELVEAVSLDEELEARLARREWPEGAVEIGEDWYLPVEVVGYALPQVEALQEGLAGMERIAGEWELVRE